MSSMTISNGSLSATTTNPFGVASTVNWGVPTCICTTVANECRTFINQIATETTIVWDDVQRLPIDCAPGDWHGTAADLYTVQLSKTGDALPSVSSATRSALLLAEGTAV